MAMDSNDSDTWNLGLGRFSLPELLRPAWLVKLQTRVSFPDTHFGPTFCPLGSWSGLSSPSASEGSGAGVLAAGIPAQQRHMPPRWQRIQMVVTMGAGL